MFDTLASLSLALVTFVIGALGVYLTLHPPEPTDRKKKSAYFWGFILLGVLGVILTGVQAYRAQSAQESAANQQGQLAKNMEYVKGQLQAVTTIVGPEARADTRRIAESLAKLSTTQNLRGQGIPRASLRERATIVAGEILGCVSEGTAMIKPLGEGNEEAMKQLEENEQRLREAASLCMQRLGPRLFSVGSELKQHFPSDERFALELELLAQHPDIGNLRDIAVRFEKISQQLK